jgi:UDP-2-acetamido-3-amino-2,3-dideoxy-glucuronate N-acetyltransferase
MSNKLEGVALISFPTVLAERGNLTALELPEVVPFHVKRIFLVHNVSNTEIRGEHAHKNCWQLLIATTGSVMVDVTDGEFKESYQLDSPEEGLLIPPLIWGTQYNYSSNAALLVLASEPFDASDYLHDFEEFKAFRKNKNR